MLSNTILALSFLPVSFAHFQLTWPAARGFNDDTAGSFPCGGFDTVQQQRTDYPLSGAPLQLKMGHDLTHVAVYLAIGSSPGSSFNTMLRQQFVVTGLGDFCIGQISVPSGMNISDGTQASIQVVSNADGTGGGLYQCTDVTLRTTVSNFDYNSHCRNNTGIAISQQNISGNPNGTSSGNSPSASGSGAAASATPKPGGASQAKAASWVMGVVGLAGLALL